MRKIFGKEIYFKDDISELLGQNEPQTLNVEEMETGVKVGEYIPQYKRYDGLKFADHVEYSMFDKIFKALNNVEITYDGTKSYDAVLQSLKNKLTDIYVTIYNNGYCYLSVKDGDTVVISERKGTAKITDEYYRQFSKSKRSILKDVWKHLDNIGNAEYEIIANRGVMGAISPDFRMEKMITPDQKKLIESRLKKYGTLKNQFKLWFSPTPIRYVKIDLPIEQLQLSEKEIMAIKKIAAVFSIPEEMLQISEKSTFDNRKTAKIEFYEDATTPFVSNCITALSESLVFFNESLTNISYPYVTVFHEMKQAEMVAKTTEIDFLLKLKDAGMLTPEETKLKINEILLK